MNQISRYISRTGLRQRLFHTDKVLKRFSSASSQRFLVQSPYENWKNPSKSIVDLVWGNMEKWPNHTAIVCSETGRSYKFCELRKACKEFGAGILAELSPGSTVAVVMPNCPEYPVVTLGCLEAGLAVTPMNPTYGSDEIKNQVRSSGAKLVLAHPSKMADVKAACPDIPVLAIGGSSSALEQVSSRGKGKDLPAISDPDTLTLLQYSSGTTGLPKGVRLTHSNIMSTIMKYNHPKVRLPMETSRAFQDVIPSILPFFHVYGFLTGLLLCLANGVKIVAIPKFEPRSFIDVLVEHKPTILTSVPPLIHFLTNNPQVTEEMLASIRITSTGASPMSPELTENFISKSGSKLVSVYGMTEASPITLSPNHETDLGSVGHVVNDTQLKIVNVDTGEIQDPSLEGEVCCKGSQVMQGYHNNEEATNSTVKDGWLYTGDIGFIGEDGKLHIVDRKKELIKVHGFQVAPVELERILTSHSGVADAGVVGIPDERSGETPVAFVVRRPNSRTTERELIDYLSTKVSAPYKRVSRLTFIDAIPRNASSKIIRRNLKALV